MFAPKKGAPSQDRALLDRSKTGSKHHLICDGGGVPLAITLTGGNRNDITPLLPLVEKIPPVRSRRDIPDTSPRSSSLTAATTTTRTDIRCGNEGSAR